MAIFDDEQKKPKKPHEIGQDLSALSVGELSERVQMLKDEIGRLEAEIRSKGQVKSAAEQFFKRG
jgi:uncharacterized small protein (DUF1192 family)